ncbi:asparagine synthase-related protein [Bradyrhizobium sp. ARR65]|uniref:asparagine synthase-related protein n=1 Tax=Bradyrhizobium sp. ARR65 TaxID=1040989 RepID=UPI0004632E71|nr:asparagine synthase-related protein [Bradyrhizobium sp. ARR65]
MRLNADGLLDSANALASIVVDGRVEITVLNDIVDAETGQPTELEPTHFKGKSLPEILALLQERYAGDAAFIVRAPGGIAIVRPLFSEISIFYQVRNDVIECWAGLKLPDAILAQRQAFNFGYLTGVMCNASWLTPETGLCGIFELLSGAALIVSRGTFRQVDFLANAVASLKTSAVSFEEAAASFRQLISASVAHKTRRYNGAFSIECSGGLDSSVVALAAADLHRDRPLSLLNSYSETDVNGDERFFFAALAERVRGVPTYVETNARSSMTHLSSELLAPTPRPCKLAATIATTAQLHEAAQAAGSRLVLTGDGGDQLFLRMRRLTMARELLAETRSPREALRELAGLAIQARASVWRVLRDVITGQSSRDLRRHMFGDLRFPQSPLASVGPDVRAELVPGAWSLRHLPTTRLFQFFGMRNPELNRIALRGISVEERKAFVFWPLIKAGLRTARRHHHSNGIDRALEREAFRHELPDVIYYRVGKGAGRDMLVRYEYGALVSRVERSALYRHGLISRDLLRSAIDNLSYDSASALVRVCAVADWMDVHEIG